MREMILRREDKVEKIGLRDGQKERKQKDFVFTERDREIEGKTEGPSRCDFRLPAVRRDPHCGYKPFLLVYGIQHPFE